MATRVLTVVGKYHSRVTEYNGRTFASKAEAHRAQELELLEKAGEIKGLQYQPEYTLMPAFEYKGKNIKRIIYKADFCYTDNITGDYIVEDVKGFSTPMWKLKQKMFWHVFRHNPHIELRVVKP